MKTTTCRKQKWTMDVLSQTSTKISRYPSAAPCRRCRPLFCPSSRPRSSENSANFQSIFPPAFLPSPQAGRPRPLGLPPFFAPFADFARVFPDIGTRFRRFFQALEATFADFSRHWNPVFLPLSFHFSTGGADGAAPSLPGVRHLAAPRAGRMARAKSAKSAKFWVRRGGRTGRRRCRRGGGGRGGRGRGGGWRRGRG